MHNTLATAATTALLTLAFAGCGGQRTSSPDANSPSSLTTTTGASTGVSTGQWTQAPGDPSGIAPRKTGTTVTSGAPASPMEGACPTGEPSRSARDLASCKASCRGLDEAVPTGSACMSSHDRCQIECRQNFFSDRP